MLAKIDPNDLSWCVLRTEPRRERMAMNALIGHRVEIYLPEKRPEFRMRRGKKIEIRSFMFPGHLLARLPPIGSRIWEMIRGYRTADGGRAGVIGGIMKIETPWLVNRVYGPDGQIQTIKPATLTDEKIEIIKAFESEKRTGGPALKFAIGQVVKALDGPFAQMMGCVEDTNERGRWKVAIGMFGGTSAVEFSEEQIEAA